MDTDAFEVVLVSPRNHFFFTPMLPSSAVGTGECHLAAPPRLLAWLPACLPGCLPAVGLLTRAAAVAHPS
jgi:hypothetical protein